MLTVACAYIPGNGFDDEYVYRLQSAVAKHCKEPHQFICLTQQMLGGIECREPRSRNRDWWIKLHLFSAFKGPTVYLDLDTMIVNDVTDIFTYPHVFTGLTGLKTKRFASGFMAWNGDFSYLDQDVDREIAKRYEETWISWGDQGFISEHLKIKPDLTAKLFPGRFVSYKWDIRRQGRTPKGASIVCFSGKPRPHEVKWVLPNGH